jgi:hypothetical protein
LEGLRIENVGTVNGPLKYFTAIWYIISPLGNGVVIWYIFHCLEYIVSIKIWHPWFPGNRELRNKRFFSPEFLKVGAKLSVIA